MVNKKQINTKKQKQEKEKQKITKDMIFSEVINRYPNLADVFFKHGMTCVGCPFAAQETIEQGAKAHGIDVKKLLDELNKKIKKKK